MEYKIAKTGDLDFSPHTLKIIVKDIFEKEVDGVNKEFIRVDTVITHETTSSLTQRLTKHEFPYEVWESIVVDYDRRTKEPILDEVKLKPILESFNIKLI